MSDIHNAAIVLMTLPPDEAAAVMSHLPAKQVEAVAIEIAQISDLTASKQETAIKDFADSSPNQLGYHKRGDGNRRYYFFY